MRTILRVVLNVVLFFLLFGLFLTPPVLLMSQQLAGAPGGVLPPPSRLAMEAAGVLAALLASLLAGRAFKGPRLSDFGLLSPRAAPQVLIGGVVGVGLIAVVLLVLHGSGALALQSEPDFPAGTVVAITMLGLFLNTMFQNIAFRGHVMGAVLAKFSPLTAMLVSSLLFVAAHTPVLFESAPNGALAGLNLFLAGMLLALAYLRARSLWLPIGIHFGWNAGWAALGLSVTGQDLLGGSALLTLSGHPLMTGGAVGPEGSLPGLIGPLVGIALVHLLVRRPSA